MGTDKYHRNLKECERISIPHRGLRMWASSANLSQSVDLYLLSLKNIFWAIEIWKASDEAITDLHFDINALSAFVVTLNVICKGMDLHSIKDAADSKNVQIVTKCSQIIFWSCQCTHVRDSTCNWNLCWMCLGYILNYIESRRPECWNIQIWQACGGSNLFCVISLISRRSMENVMDASSNRNGEIFSYMPLTHYMSWISFAN